MVANNDEATTATMFPNPAHNRVTVKISSPSYADYNIKLTDMTGRLLMAKTVKVEKGDNLFNINIIGLARGLYNVSLENEQRIKNIALAVE